MGRALFLTVALLTPNISSVLTFGTPWAGLTNEHKYPVGPMHREFWQNPPKGWGGGRWKDTSTLPSPPKAVHDLTKEGPHTRGLRPSVTTPLVAPKRRCDTRGQ